MDYLYSAAIAGLPLLLIELIARKNDSRDDELWRKLTHILSSLAVMASAVIFGHEQLFFVAAFFLIVILTIRFYGRWESLKPLHRETYGEVLFPIGVGLASLIAPNQKSFIFAMMCLGFVDVAAYIVGRKWGKRKIYKLSKTIEGSSAAFVVGCLLSLLFLQSVSAFGVISAGLILSISELIGISGSDNVTVPLAALVVFNYF
jgi:dolichol kinase